MHRLTRVVGACAIAATMAFASHAMTTSAAGSTVVVTPAHQQGWTPADVRSTGMANFITDPSSPLPPGALQLTTGAGDTAAKYQYLHAANVPLSSVSELSYYTKQNSASFPGGDPSYQLVVDLLGPGSGFTTLVYEPYENGVVTPGTWQPWDVAAGQFWSSKSVTDGGSCTTVAGAGGAPFYTLAELQAACPNAVVIGFGVNVGSNNPGYNVETDGVDFNGTVYDFQTTNEPTSKDQCKDGGWQNLT